MKKQFIMLNEAFNEFVKASAKGNRLEQSGKRISAGVIDNYAYALKLLEEYETKVGEPLRIIPLNKASLMLIKKEHQYWLNFYIHFSKYLFIEKGFYDNYVAATFKILKSVFNYVKNTKGIPIGDYHKLFTVSTQPIVPVVLLPEQVHYLIHDTGLTSKLPAWLRRTKDILVFGCTTGLRIGDLMALKQKNLAAVNNDHYLSIYTQKTNTYIQVPLPSYCVDIIDRYKKRNKGFLLPRLSKTNINVQIKEIGKRAGWDWALPKYRTRQGILVEQKIKGQSWKFYQHLTAHTMRRTAITTLLMLGVDEAVVRKISGHAPGSKEFYRYIALAQSYMDNQVRTAHRRLSENPAHYKCPAISA